MYQSDLQNQFVVRPGKIAYSIYITTQRVFVYHAGEQIVPYCGANHVAQCCDSWLNVTGISAMSCARRSRGPGCTTPARPQCYCSISVLTNCAISCNNGTFSNFGTRILWPIVQHKEKVDIPRCVIPIKIAQHIVATSCPRPVQPQHCATLVHKSSAICIQTHIVQR